MEFEQLINHLHSHDYKSLYPVTNSEIYSLSDYNLGENVMLSDYNSVKNVILGALCENGKIWDYM